MDRQRMQILVRRCRGGDAQPLLSGSGNSGSAWSNRRRSAVLKRRTVMDPSRTSMDPRFSDPIAVPVGWEETRGLLESAELFWLSTVRTDGRPHVTPLVAVWLDEAIHFSTGAAEQKAINLHANPHVVLITGCNTWDRGADIVVEGNAVRVTRHSRPERLA